MTGTIGVKCLDKVEAFCNRVCFYEEHGLETYKKNLSARLKSIYHCQRIAITTVDNYTEKKRVAEIDKLFKETYFNYAQKVTVQEKIMYTIPGVWFLCYKLKKKLFNK